MSCWSTCCESKEKQKFRIEGLISNSSTVKQLTIENHSQKQTIERNQKLIEDLNTKVRVLESNIEDISKENSLHKEKHEKKRKKNRELKKGFNEQKEKLEKVHKSLEDKSKELVDVWKKSSEELRELESRLSDSQYTVKELEDGRRRVEELLDSQRASMESQLRSLELNFNEERKGRVLLKEEFENLLNEKQSVESEKTNLEDLMRVELSKKSEEIRKLKGKKKEIKEREKKLVNETQEKLRHAQESIQSKEAEIIRLNEQSMGKEKRYIEEITEFEVKLKSLESEVYESNLLIEERNSRLNGLQVRINTLDTELSVSRTELEQLRSENGKQSSLIEEKELNISSLNETLTYQNEYLSTTESELALLKSQLTESQNLLRTLPLEKHEDLEVLEGSNTEILKLQGKIEELNQICEFDEEKINGFVEELQVKEQHIRTLEANIESLAQQLSEQRKRNEEYTGHKDSLSAELKDKLKVTENNFQASLKSHENEKQVLKERMSIPSQGGSKKKPRKRNKKKNILRESAEVLGESIPDLIEENKSSSSSSSSNE